MKISIPAGILSLCLVSGVGWADSAALNQQPLAADSIWNAAVSPAWDLWLAYYSKERTLYLRDPKGSEMRVGFPERPQAPVGLELGLDGDGPAVLWRDKLPEKAIYYMRPGQAPLSIAGESEPLPRMRFARTGDQEYCLWYGEQKAKDSGEKFNIYFRAAKVGGGEPGPVQRVLPGIYPVWILDEQGPVVFSNRTQKNGQFWLTQRQYDPTKGTFGPVGEVAPMPETGPVFDAYLSGKRWFVLWLGVYDTDFRLEGLYSDDRGATWQHVAFDGLRGVDVSKMSFTTDHQGHLLLAVSGPKRTGQKQTKEDVYVLSSADNGNTWSEPLRIRLGVAPDTFNARYPSVSFGATPGEALLVWEDWRDIRGAVYAAVTRDTGKTWSPGVRLTELTYNHTQPYWMRTVSAQKDGYRVLSERFRDDAMQIKDVVDISVTAENLEGMVRQATSKISQDVLRPEHIKGRVSAYWDTFLKDDYRAAYPFLDPYFRGSIPLDAYLKRMGRIKYHAVQVGEVKINGNLASVGVQIEASVPAFLTPEGKTVSRDKETITFVETWLLVDGDWYRQYYEESTDTRWTRF